MNLKKNAIYFLRKFNIFYEADYLRFLYHRLKSRSERKRFREAHPDFVLPPDYFLYETHKLDYNSYYLTGRNTAKVLNEIATKYLDGKSLHILDWGCGPGRVIRNFPALRPESEFSGTDYNEKYSNWCTENIPGVTFKTNSLEPPLKFDNECFDMVYGLSIFTHLSREKSVLWFNELNRVLKPGGILILTFHGETFNSKLTDEEKEKLKSGQFYERGSKVEGHRSYSSYQSSGFIRSLLKENNEILEFRSGTSKGDKSTQDLYVIRKN